MWVVDHLLQADPNAAPDQRDMLEAYTTLGYLAAHTERVRLGTMVTGVTFRPPALLVKAVTTLDVLTGDQAPFDGTYYRLRRPLGIPGPAHRPHPPILIGGWGRTPDPAAGRAVRRCVAAAALGIKHMVVGKAVRGRRKRWPHWLWPSPRSAGSVHPDGRDATEATIRTEVERSTNSD